MLKSFRVKVSVGWIAKHCYVVMRIPKEPLCGQSEVNTFKGCQITFMQQDKSRPRRRRHT